jgi:acyl-CoA thioesterase
VSAFDRATAVRRRPANDATANRATGNGATANGAIETSYDVDLDLGWSIGGRPNGGYLLAAIARAATDAAGREHPLAVSGHFLRPPAGGPALVRTEVMKTGRTVATVRATLWQDERACLDVLVTAGALPASPPDHVGTPMPVMPPPEECRARAETDFRVELLDHVDVRIDPETVPFHGNHGEPVIRGWMSLRDGSPADPLALLLAVDVAPPTVFRLGLMGWAPTVELSALVRAVPAPGWLAFEAEASLVAGGWFDENATVWDSTGRVVAQARQLALVGR